MKIWRGYGSEHSMNLVMIGHFKNSADAEKTQELIQYLTDELRDRVNVGESPDAYTDEVRKILRDKECYTLRPFELEHFLYDHSTHLEGDKIILRTDESEVSGYFKLMVHNGAKVEIYSAHDYPAKESDKEK